MDITASRSRGRWLEYLCCTRIIRLRILGVQARKEVVDRKDFDSMVCLALYALKNMLAMHFSKLKKKISSRQTKIRVAQ